MARFPADRSSDATFNVKDYGATGRRSDDAKPSIQKAINACAAAGGGTLYLPPGEYTSGGLKLLSHVRLYLEAGATLFAADDPGAYDLSQLLWPQRCSLHRRFVPRGRTGRHFYRRPGNGGRPSEIHMAAG
jgi:polygalacturonase